MSDREDELLLRSNQGGSGSFGRSVGRFLNYPVICRNRNVTEKLLSKIVAEFLDSPPGS